MELRQTTKKQVKIKLALQGCAGSGKTYSALLLAYGLCHDWNKIAIIDTENGSADLYASLGEYNVLQLKENFTPENYIEAINVCESAGMEVIIIDSISLCWDNLLEYHANLQGNSFTNWQKITPRMNAFMQKILQSNKHIICTMRCKQDYVLNEKNGKMVPEKVGLKAVMRDGIDYEFTIVFDINKISDWCNDGVSMQTIKQQIKDCQTLEELTRIYHQYPEYYQQLNFEFVEKKKHLQNSEKRFISQTFNYIQNGNNAITTSQS